MTGRGLHPCLFVPQAVLLNPSCWLTRCLHLPSTPCATCLPFCGTPWLRIALSAATQQRGCSAGMAALVHERLFWGGSRAGFVLPYLVSLGACCVACTLRAHPAAVGVDMQQQQQLACCGSCRGCRMLLRAVLFPACATLLLVVWGVQVRGPCVLCWPLCWTMGLASGLLPFFGLRGRESC